MAKLGNLRTSGAKLGNATKREDAIRNESTPIVKKTPAQRTTAATQTAKPASQIAEEARRRNYAAEMQQRGRVTASQRAQERQQEEANRRNYAAQMQQRAHDNDALRQLAEETVADRFSHSSGKFDAAENNQPSVWQRIFGTKEDYQRANIVAAEFQAREAANDEYTPFESFALGAAQKPGSLGIGIAKGVSEITGNGGENLKDLNEMYRQAQQENSGAYNAGDMAATMALMQGISSGLGAVKGFDKLPSLARSVISGAASFGGSAAIGELGAAATGDISGKKYAADVIGSALGGAAGGGISNALSSAGANFITKNGLKNNTLAKTIVSGLSGSGFAVGNTGTKYIANLLGFNDGEEVTAEQLAKDVLVAFAFGSISYILQNAANGFTTSDPEPEYEWKYFRKDMTPEEAKTLYRKLAFENHPDRGGSTEIMAEINSEYERFANEIVNKAASAYQRSAKASSSGNEYEAASASEEYAKSVYALQDLANDGIISGKNAAEAIEILSAAATGGMAAEAAAPALTQVPETPATSEPTPEDMALEMLEQQAAQQAPEPAENISNNFLPETSENDKIIPTLEERILKAENMQISGASPSEIYSETGLVTFANGSLSDGFGGPVVKEAANGKEIETGSSGNLQNAVRRENVTGGTAENGRKDLRAAFSTLGEPEKSRGADIIRRAINENPETGILVDIIDDEVLNKGRDLDEVLREYAGRIYDDILESRIVAEQKWGSTIANSGSLFDDLLSISSGGQAPSKLSNPASLEPIAETLGNSGKKALVNAYDGETQTDVYAKEFLNVYNAAQNGGKLPETNALTEAQRFAAEAAGKNDVVQKSGSGSSELTSQQKQLTNIFVSNIVNAARKENIDTKPFYEVTSDIDYGTLSGSDAGVIASALTQIVDELERGGYDKNIGAYREYVAKISEYAGSENSLLARLTNSNRVTDNGLIYTITQIKDGYVGDIRRDNSAMDGMISDARSGIYHSEAFETREEAVNDLIAVAENNRMTEPVEKEVTTNESAGVDRGREVSGTGGAFERAVREAAEKPESGTDVPADRGSGEVSTRDEQSGDRLGRERAGNAAESTGAAAEAGTGAEKPVKKQQKLNKNNYRITEDIDSKRPNYADNLAAIKVVKQLEAEGRKATPEERAILAKYKGWGGLKDDILAYHKGELQRFLSKEEYEAAKDSIINAHYTSTKVISGMYKAISRMGFTGGNILEPSMGVGNFFGMLPKNLSANSSLYGVELDKITGQIAQNLYPDAKIDVAGFQDVLYPDNTFDLVVGNVPFSNDIKIPYRGEKYNLHDFFFVKALDETKPGGVLALITSTGTLDKISGKTQSAIAKRGNLIAAFRLPDNAFKTNAGTSVTTDLIFLQKKGDGIEDNGIAFTRVGTIDGIPINEYYVEHPKNILGTLAYEKGMYANERTVVHATPDFESRFEKAMNSLPKGLMTADGAASAPAPVTAKRRGERTKTTFTKTKDGVSIGTDGGKIEKVSGKSADVAEDYLKVKGAYFSLIDAERSGNLEAAEQYRDALNRQYDSFVKKHGPISKNDKLLKQDDDFIRVSGLEVVQKKGAIGKSAIFTTPTISRAKKTSAGSSEEALSISLNEDGKIDLDHMAALTGKSRDTILKELDDEIIQSPDGEYVLTSQYLSGNIYEKLDAVEGKKGFERQAALLKASIPTPKAAKDISAEFGSHWIPAKYVSEFIRDTFSTYGYVDVEYNKELGQWDLNKFYSPVQKYSTERVSAADIVKNTLNGKNISVYDKDSEGKKILNKKATEAAQQKQNDLREAFRQWIFKDNERRTDLESIFNRTLNAYAPMDYKGLSERIDFGISPDSRIKPRDYQKEAVARIVFGGNTLLHHGVGTGKTATMIMSAHVLKQSGISNKPMFVVPNGKVNDFRNEILGLYPDANILALDNKSMSPAELQHTKSMIATGDWDYVIIYRTAFEKIPVSPDTEAAFIQAQLDDMEQAIRENGGKKNGTTRFEKGLSQRKQTLEEKLKAALDRPKDNSLNFEDLGVDSLFIDEAHNYKKVGFATTHTISGIDSSTNNITTDLYLKENFIRNHGGRIVLATATPLTNTLSEMYNMTLHVNPEALRSAGIYSFDGWLNTFADIQSQPEIAPDGKTWRIKERVRGFKSGNELIGIYRQFADVKQTKDVVNDLPKAEFIDVVSEGTEYHQRLLDNFAERSGRPKDGKDNMLLITSDGRAAGTDLRLLTGLLQELYPGITAEELDLPGSKINRAVENIIKEYRASTPSKGTQFVFLDVGIHDSEGRYAFNLYTDLIDKLAANGIPREEIANIQDYDGEEKRSTLYDAMNSGKIRVLIGSTAKMGEGVNAQNKSVALHHLNVPYRPDNLEQREGRTIRHGNENKNVRIYRYIQEKSFDSYLWQMIERKSAYVAQALNGGDASDLEESSEAIVNAREAKAIATGNPLIMEKVELQDKISKLKLLQSSFYDEQRQAAQRIASNDAKIRELKTELAQAKKDAATVEKNKTDEFSMTVGKKTYDSRKEAGEALAAEKQIGKIGRLYGLDIYRDSASEVSLRGAGKYTVELGDSPDGNSTRLVNAATKTVMLAEGRITRSIEALKANTKDAQETANSTFSRQDELDAAVKRQNEVDRELGIIENEVSFDDIAVSESGDVQLDTSGAASSDPADRWTTTRISSGNPDAQPKSITEIVEGIRQNFGFNITAGHVRGSGVRGQFNPQDKGIRSKLINDLPTISHELGHALDNRYGILKNKLSPELKKELADNLSDEKKASYPKEKWASEGIAEFVRAFLTNSETAAIDYPQFTDFFKKSLSGKDLALIEQLADDVNAYYSLGAETAGSIRLREDGRPDYRSGSEKIRDMGDGVYQAWIDSNHGLKVAEEAMGGSGRAYTLASNSAYSNNVAGRIITGDLTDANGQYVGPGLKTALNGINTRDKKEYMDFNEYLVVRHGPERLANGMRIFADDRKNSTEWMNKRRAALEAQYPEFDAAATRLIEFERQFNEVWGVGYGLIDKDVFGSWGEKYQNHVPLNRVIERGGRGAKRGYANQNSPYKRAKGSGRDIIAPVDNIIDEVVRVVNTAMRNNVMLELRKTALKYGDANFMEKVPTPMKPKTVDLSGVKSQLQDAVENSGIDPKALFTVDGIIGQLDDVMTQFERRGPYGDVVTVLVGGNPEYWKINDPLLLQSVTNMTGPKLGAFMEAYGAVTRFMTANITGNNAVWSIFSNAPRDLATFLTYTKDKKSIFKAFGNIGSAYVNSFKENYTEGSVDPLFAEYLALGGGNTSAYSADKNLAKKAREKLTSGKAKRVLDAANPINAVSFITDTIEMGPRFATYKTLRNAGLDPQEAFYEAMDITVNFRKGGVKAREVNKIFPFFNASLQGIDKFGRFFSAEDQAKNGKQARKKAVFSRWGMFIGASAILAALNYVLNQHDDEDEKNYQQLSNYTKNSYYTIPLGDGKYFAIPKPRELAVLTSLMQAGIDYGVKGNAHAFDEFYGYAVDQFLPSVISDLVQLPTNIINGGMSSGLRNTVADMIGDAGIIGVFANVGANRDFLGRPIESGYMQYFEAKDRWTESTSKIAYWLGQAFDLSPTMIDYVGNQVLGYLWKYQKALLPVDAARRDLTLGVKNSYVKDNVYSTDIVNWMYDQADKSARAAKSDDGNMEKVIASSMDNKMTSFYSNFNKLNKVNTSESSKRTARQKFLDVLTDYRDASENQTVTKAQKSVYDVVKATKDTSLLPAVMNTTVKNSAGKEFAMSDLEYYEYQTNYLSLYYEYVEKNLRGVKNTAEKAKIIKAAKDAAKAKATDRVLARVGTGDSGYFTKYGDVSANNVIKFKSKVDAADDDGSLKQEEVTEIVLAMIENGLSYEDAYTLFHSKYDSDKNNPWAEYKN